MPFKNKKILIIGIGNVLMKDEGIGIHAIHKLVEKNFILSPEIEIIDGGTMGLGILEYMKDKNMIIIIDAVDFKQAPGTIYKFNFNSIKNYKKHPEYSMHQIDILDTINILHTLYNHFPDIIVIGMQPFDISFGLQLSEVAQNKLDELLELVIHELQGLQ